MRQFILFATAVCAVFNLHAQSSEEIRSFDAKYMTELYRVYPIENIDKKLSPAPKGYEPFYISQLSRHGSRWHSGTSIYKKTLPLLQSAYDADELTELGKRYLLDCKMLVADAENRNGELTQTGMEQHRGIARRMVQNFPEIFAKGKACRLDCRSTIVPRCILSMAAAVSEYTRLVPNVEVRMESSEDNAYLKAYTGLNSIKDEALPLSDSLRRAYMPDTKPFMARIFKENSSVASTINANDFMYNLFLLNAIKDSAPIAGVDPNRYLFTEEEQAAVWRASNIRRYALTGPSKPYISAIIEGIKPFVRNVIECADRAIAEGDYQATLQYAHDVTIIPFVKFMGIECGNLTTDDYANVSYKWRINEVTPMATNVQMIFYRNKQNDILVKIMHNEREQIIDPTIAKPAEGVYYRWSELREYMLAKSIISRR